MAFDDEPLAQNSCTGDFVSFNSFKSFIFIALQELSQRDVLYHFTIVPLICFTCHE